MNILCLNIIEPYLSYILNGQKTIEGRLNKDKFKDLKINDKLLIGPAKNIFIVTAINNYKSFREMINSEGIENVVPDKKTTAEAEEVYYRFYTPEQEREFGVLAIKIKAVNNK